MGLVDRELLFFPEGEPASNEVYVRHPLRRRDYWPFADYHRLLLHEKSVEAARYLLSLGATDVTIRWVEDTRKRRGGRASAKIPSRLDISTDIGFAEDNSGDLTITITGASQKFDTPTDLIWPRHDPLFKLAHDVATARSREFRFGITTEQSRSVNAAAGADLRVLGLSLGGDYKRWEDIIFTVEARFDPRNATDNAGPTDVSEDLPDHSIA
jgi:hypothetical protein